MAGNALHVLDGYGLIFRAYFAFARSPMRNDKGQPTGAVFGFFRVLTSYIKQYKPGELVIALDAPGKTFREDLYPAYKATRDATPDDLRFQFPIIEEILTALKIPTLRVPGFEADDIMATLALKCQREGKECVVVSADKDMLQLVSMGTRVLRPSKEGGFVEMDRAAVMEDKGVWPEQILDYLSLLGDASDNVPGVKGVGEKTAAKLLQDFGDLDAIYARVGEISSASLQAKILAGRDDAALSKKLIALCYEVPLEDSAPFSLDSIDGPAAAALLREQSIRQLADEIGRLGSKAEDVPVDEGDEEERAEKVSRHEAGLPVVDRESRKSLVGDLGPYYGKAGQEYRVFDDVDQLEKFALEIVPKTAFSVHLVHDVPDDVFSPLLGIAIAVRPGVAAYAPVSSIEAAAALLGKLFSESAGLWYGFRQKQEIRSMLRLGFQLARPHVDGQIAAWLMDTTESSYEMEDVARRWLAYQVLLPAQLLPGVKAPERRFSSIPADKLGIFASEYADIGLRLALFLEQELERKGMSGLLHELEMPVLPILARIEDHGMRLDPGVLEKYSLVLEAQIQELENDIYKEVGHPFNIASPKQLQDVLFVERKLKGGKKTKTGYSTDVSVLEELALEDKVPQLILDYRGLTKLKSTYVDALPKLVNPATGKIHTSLIQTGTATGRLSSKDPNLQNIPIKVEAGRYIRKAFIAKPGSVLVSADYSQIELVVLAHLSEDPALCASFVSGEDVHRATASLLFDVFPEMVTVEQRRIAKTINFGVMYGMSAFRLAREMGIPNKQAQAFIDAYFVKYRRILAFMENIVRDAETNGGVTTIMGRFRPIPGILAANRTEKQAAERVAVNSPIQGSAADIVKLAMIRLDKRIARDGLKARLILQVHDELILECPAEEKDTVIQVLREEMPAAMNLRIPLRVSVESSTNWGDMH